MGDGRHEPQAGGQVQRPLLVYAFVTAGGARFLLLHDVRNEENVKNFFHEVHELYLRVALDPFHDARAPIASPGVRRPRPGRRQATLSVDLTTSRPARRS